MADKDRISELPEPILHRILSFLSQKQAIQTSALSRPWRDVGPTLPRIELRESWFESSSSTLLSILGNTLQRYNHRNLSVQEFILDMSLSSSSLESVLHEGIPILLANMRVEKFYFSVPGYVLAPSVVFLAEFLTELCLSQCKFTTTTFATNDHDHGHDQPLFKGLKRLSLNEVHLEDETLEKITRACPLIQYLLVSGCAGLTSIPASIFQAEFLTELHLSRGNLIITIPTDLLLIKRLKTLSLNMVKILEETLEKIMSSCPLIERVLLFDCVGLKNIHINNNSNSLKHFTGSYYAVYTKSIEINALTIETIRILRCPNWYARNNYFYPRLKSLYLSRVKLSEELLESFSSNFSSLEELELHNCPGFQEIQLTVCSMKRLVLNIDLKNPIKATIYAPNIQYFMFDGLFPPQLSIYTETAREWKSHVVMSYNTSSDDKVSVLPWLLQLQKLLNSLSESEISLDVSPNPFKNLKVEDTNDAGFCKPVPLEHLNLKRGNQFSSFPDFLNHLFLICRPRYIGITWYNPNYFCEATTENNKLAEFIIYKIIRNQGEMSQGHLWERDLEEISMQVWDENSEGWHTVRVEGTSLPEFTSSELKIRFPVKWRD